MNKLEQYLIDNGYINKGNYWKKDGIYIQFDSVILRISTKTNHQDYPIALINAYPYMIVTLIKSVKGAE